MMRRQRSACWIFGLAVLAQDGRLRVFEGEGSPDPRLHETRDLRDADHPWSPPTTRKDWEDHSRDLREQTLVAAGLWPRPKLPPPKAQITRVIDRDDYTISAVAIETLGSHHLTGSLYVPKEHVPNPRPGTRRPAVLSPHGHWRDGRFYDAGAEEAKRQLDAGAESMECAARYPLQARMVRLARMGCVVFHYDMLGYASSRGIDHRRGFEDADALLRLHSHLGLQTLHSILAFDYLAGRSDVDPDRIGVTGGSGGGTQSFMLGAVDSRVAAAFPAVMVSTAMQGGCVCENAPYLRQNINNIALASLFAPRPMAMSGADDWTIDIETKGLPEMQRVWQLYGRGDAVAAKCDPQFGHNYNEHARSRMVRWFARHLELAGGTPLAERSFVPATRDELEVFPDGGEPTGTTAEVREAWSQLDEHSLKSILDPDRATRDLLLAGLGPPLRVFFGRPPEFWEARPSEIDRAASRTGGVFQRSGSKDAVPFAMWTPDGGVQNTVVIVSGQGKASLENEDGSPTGLLQSLLDRHTQVVAIDVLGVGEATRSSSESGLRPVHEGYAGYTFCYNRPVFCDRVRDVVTAWVALRQVARSTHRSLIGIDGAGHWTLLAASVLELGRAERPDLTIVDFAGRGLTEITSATDPELLPGARKYGGLGGLGALATAGNLHLFGTDGIPAFELAPFRSDAAWRSGTILWQGTYSSADLLRVLPR